MVKSWMNPCWSGLPYTKLEAGERLDPKIGGGETAFPCVLWHFNPWTQMHNRKYARLNITSAQQ